MRLEDISFVGLSSREEQRVLRPDLKGKSIIAPVASSDDIEVGRSMAGSLLGYYTTPEKKKILCHSMLDLPNQGQVFWMDIRDARSTGKISDWMFRYFLEIEEGLE